ncbi:lactonase family protein [Streptomyces aurantiacus]|uniref:Putative 6-phosphogluconolactonase n=1 Tax=Streptomyces aurantiacus JA 4570 TaxID=1286094 RepID=S4AQ68_9ACTN|nr:lactonase family protein [Streptomyces aurantiacus]EPH43592.1 putative 6-phosphogluconolactonase [Streptomyces aurantiacus JA 4570]
MGGGQARRAYIGSFTQTGGPGVVTAAFDPATGELAVLGATDAVADPSYLALSPDGGTLYAVSETTEGAVAAFSTAGDTARPLGEPVPVRAEAPTHLALHDGHVHTANYGSGSVTTVPVRSDGSLASAPAAVVEHRGSGPDPERQEGPHAHQVLPDPSGRWVLSVDLGTDSVRVCAPDEGGLTPRHEVAFRPGTGPRHLAFHPRGHIAYVLNELTPTLTVCSWDPADGTLRPLAETPVLPAGAHPSEADAYPSEIVVAPDGRFLWTATRGVDVISVFALDDAGAGARLTACEPCGGVWPRDLALDPSGRFLYAANERSGDVTWFALDAETGLPRRAGAIDVPAASCVVFG